MYVKQSHTGNQILNKPKQETHDCFTAKARIRESHHSTKQKGQSNLVRPSCLCYLPLESKLDIQTQPNLFNSWSTGFTAIGRRFARVDCAWG